MTEKDYLLQHGAAATVPQSEPLRDDQVANSAGGFTWAVDDFTLFRRFLILGSEGGSYYVSERDLTKQNLDNVRKLARTDGLRMVGEIVDVSENARAPKNDPALYALAVAMTEGDKATRKAAAEALPRVARIGTHLFHFCAYIDAMRGWGKTSRWAVSNWYAVKENLGYDVIKYQSRDGFSHRDVLRLAHPQVKTAAARSILGFVSGNVGHEQGLDDQGRVDRKVLPWTLDAYGPDARAHELRMIEGFLKAREAKTPRETAALVREYGLPREALNSDHLTDPDVWRAMLDQKMPVMAMVRNLGNMTKLGVVEGDYRRLIVDTLGDQEIVRKSKIHPIAFLLALATYGQGHGYRGRGEWVPVPAIMDAVDAAFYLAFANVETTGKRFLLAVDCSGSMGWQQSCVAGTPLTSYAAAAAMAMVTVHAEEDVEVCAFDTQLKPLGISRRQRLDDVVRVFMAQGHGGTDCAKPMLWATANGREYDCFSVYTDNETWAGAVHPSEALTRYRRATEIPARLVVVGMAANKFTMADPHDAGMLDVVGFDAAAPGIIGEFAAGRV